MMVTLIWHPAASAALMMSVRFVFSFNRTHETVRVPVEGEVVVSSFADVDGETASIKPNGVIVTKQ